MEEKLTVEQLWAELERERAEKKRILMTAKAKSILKQRGLPEELTAFIVADDEEKLSANADVLAQCVNSAVSAKISERLKGYQPEAGAAAVHSSPEEMSDEEYYRAYKKR